jgi:release factor glutamine methyltransferase
VAGMTDVRIVAVPGTFRPRSDSWLLAQTLVDTLRRRAAGSRVLDVGTGSGALATIAALCGARATAIDRSRRAVLSARLTARANGTALRALRGDLLTPVCDERFDVIVSNPPYVPAADAQLPAHGARRATDAGLDGRALLDRICTDGPNHLQPGGEILLVHSAVCGADATLRALRRAGLEADVVARRRGPLGPLLRERRSLLEERGLLARGAEHEDLLVLRGRAGRA